MDNPFDGATTPEVKFDDLVGEDKRYKTNDDVAHAIVEKDLFIERLKQEAAEAREAAVKAANQDEFLKRLEEVTRKSPEPQNPPEVRRDEPAVTVTPEDIEKVIEEREAKKAAETNLNGVVSKLQELFGNDWRSRVQSKAKELGVSTQFLTDVATKSPKAFYTTMGISETTSSAPAGDAFAPPRSSVNPSAPPTSGKKDMNYWHQQRKEKGEAWYFSLPVQNEIWKAAKEAQKRGEPF